MDPLSWLRESDPTARAVSLAIARKTEELRSDERRQLARLIRNEVVEAIK